MSIIRFLVLFLFIYLTSCNKLPSNTSTGSTTEKKDTIFNNYLAVKGAFLTTRYASLAELKSEIEIEYIGTSHVRLTHSSNGKEVISELKPGVSEKEFMNARLGSFWDKLWIIWRSPYAILNRKKLFTIYELSRRKDGVYGSGDVAFYDLAETTVHHITSDDLTYLCTEDFTEKGYLNTFNHISAQAFMTSIYSEKIADFIADVHERSHMPELITGKFSEAQRTDLLNGPVDNYIDIINNEWGQELGKLLKKKYKITPSTHWTPILLTNYLNDLQQYYSWVFQIGLHPFRPTDDLVIRFSKKINTVMKLP